MKDELFQAIAVLFDDFAMFIAGHWVYLA